MQRMKTDWTRLSGCFSCFCCRNRKDKNERADGDGAGGQGEAGQKEKHEVARHHRRTRPSFRKRIAEFFKLRNDRSETFADEIVGGITMYLVSLLMMTLANGLQANPPSTTNNSTVSNTGHTIEQYHALSTLFALSAGISSIFVGIIGNLPFVVAPGVVHLLEYKKLSLSLQSPAGVNAANLVVGAALTLISLTSKYINPVLSVPEDFRLGVASGIGGFLCLLGLWDSYILSRAGGIINVWNYKTILSMVGLVLLIVLDHRGRGLTRYSLIIEIAFITMLSLIARAASDTLSIPDVMDKQLDSTVGQISFKPWSTSPFDVLRYIIWNILNKYINILSSITAITLAACINRTGFNSEYFHKSVQESRAIALVFFADGLCNLIVAPLLGVGLVTPYIESVAGVAVGARTGLSAVICGCLFLITSPFAEQIASIIQTEASGPALIMSCFVIIKCMRYTDEKKAVRFVPSYLVFMMIPLSQDMGGSVAFSFIILFCSWLLTSMWMKITPQMVFGFAMSLLLAIMATGLLSDFDQLAITSISLVISGIFASFLTYLLKDKMKDLFGYKSSHGTFEASDNLSRKPINIGTTLRRRNTDEPKESVPLVPKQTKNKQNEQSVNPKGRDETSQEDDTRPPNFLSSDVLEENKKVSGGQSNDFITSRLNLDKPGSNPWSNDFHQTIVGESFNLPVKSSNNATGTTEELQQV